MNRSTEHAKFLPRWVTQFLTTNRFLTVIVCLGILVTLASGAAFAASQARAQAACELPAGNSAKIATAKLIIEYNATNDDMGVHGAFDDHGWSKLCVFDPNGKLVLQVKPRSQLQDLTIAGIFFESREPPIADFPFAALKARFPEGKYQVRALKYDGTGLKGAATFTHNVPAKPNVISPTEGAVVPRKGLDIVWEPVTRTIEGKPVTISGYEVIITKVNHDDPNGFSRPVFDVHVPPDRNRLSVSVEFLEPATDYELEVLALEESGNQTIHVGSFRTK